MHKKIFLLISILFCLYSFGFTQHIILNAEIDNKLKLSSETFEKLVLSNQLGNIDVMDIIEIDSNKHFTEIRIQGYSYGGEIGAPKLPIKTNLIEVPQGAKIKVKILSRKYKEIALNKSNYPFPIVPMQAPISKNETKPISFVLNLDIYAQNIFLPNDLVKVEEIGEMRGTRLAHLIVSPFSYNPRKNILRIYTDLSFEVIFEDADMGKTLKKKQIYKNRISENLSNLCLNQKSYTTINNKVNDNQAQKYVIVSDTLFKNELQKFIAWKRQQGYDIVELYTSNPLVGKTGESIRAYLKKLYLEATPYNAPPSYILLVGDIAQIPSFHSKLPNNPAIYTQNHISDLYYAEYTDDYLPDVLYGRFSANTVEELRAQLEKTLVMEQLKLPSQSFMDTSILIAGYDKTYGESHLNPQIRYAEQYYFNNDEGISPIIFTYPKSKDMRNDIIKAFNNGANIISYTGHGTETAWANIGITTTHIREALTNTNKYPFVLGNCCLTGKFDHNECFGEALLRADKKGAVAYIGASNNSYFDEDLYWTIGFGEILGPTLIYENTGLGIYDKLFHTHGENPDKWAFSVAEIMTQGNLSVLESNSVLQDYYWEIYHVFGDPSYMPYKKMPVLPKAIHASTIVKGESLFRVESEAFAYIALSSDIKLYGATTADENGLAEIKLTKISKEDSLTLHITAQFCAPYSQKIYAKQASEAFLIVDSIQILNEKGIICNTGEYNTTYKLEVNLLNLGMESTRNCILKLTSSHPLVRVSDTTILLDTPLASNTTKTLSQILPFHIDANVKDQELIDFYIEVKTNDQTLSTYKFSYFVQASKLVFSDFKIDDRNSSQYNRQLDIDEEVEGVLQIQNKGKESARNCILQIETDSDFISTPTEPIKLGELLSDEIRSVRFVLSSNKNAVKGEPYHLIYKFNSDDRLEVLENTGIISANIEDFEDSNFNLLPWSVEKSDWLISTEFPYEGQYCASSRPIGDNEQCSLEISMYIPKKDSIHFYYKVANEKPNNMFGDFLHFYINDKSMQTYGGSIPWTKASFAVDAGNTIFRWAYQKDASVSFDLDKVWIDRIEFPIGAMKVSIEEMLNSLNKEHGFKVWQNRGNEIGIELFMNQSCRGSLYLINLLGQKVCTLSQDLSIIGQEKTFLSYPINSLPNSFYICIFESIEDTHSPIVLSRKIVLAR